jgi:hypothetical protein
VKLAEPFENVLALAIESGWCEHLEFKAQVTATLATDSSGAKTLERNHIAMLSTRLGIYLHGAIQRLNFHLKTKRCIRYRHF